MKCDGARPCVRCAKNNVPCTYSAVKKLTNKSESTQSFLVIPNMKMALEGKICNGELEILEREKTLAKIGMALEWKIAKPNLEWR